MIAGLFHVRQNCRKTTVTLTDPVVRVSFLLPASDHAHDIPVLKQAEAEYSKLQ